MSLDELSIGKKVAGAGGISVAALLGLVIVLGDARWALASNLQSAVTSIELLARTVQLDREERAEYKVQDIERRMKRILVVPVVERSVYQTNELVDLEFDKKEALRIKADIKRL